MQSVMTFNFHLCYSEVKPEDIFFTSKYMGTYLFYFQIVSELIWLIVVLST